MYYLIISLQGEIMPLSFMSLTQVKWHLKLDCKRQDVIGINMQSGLVVRSLSYNPRTDVLS